VPDLTPESREIHRFTDRNQENFGITDRYSTSIVRYFRLSERMTGQQNQAFGAKMQANRQEPHHFARQATGNRACLPTLLRQPAGFPNK